jgi:membrane fusion protein, heavy metal efflux system
MSVKRNILVGLIAVGTVFSSGLLVGIIAPWGTPRASTQAEGEEEDSHDDHENVVVLTKEQREMIDLKMRRVISAPYRKSTLIPGSVVEKPGRSSHIVSTTVNGIVTRVHAVPGQAVNPGDPLFDLQLTGEALATAQSELLGILKKLDINQSEIERLKPLAESGGIAGKQKLELEYTRKQLLGQRDVRSQELLVRGLNNTQIDGIVSTEKLLREFTVRVPDFNQQSPKSNSSKDLTQDSYLYTIEDLDVFPGKSVRPGDDLSHLAWHAELYVEGQAFEDEIENLIRLKAWEWDVTLQLGLGEYEETVKGFEILYIDNHVDVESQTFRFYIPLKNDVLTETLDRDGNVFRTWRYKPGQRVHISIPVKVIEGQFPLPITAIVEDGVNTFVFKRLQHDHAAEEEGDDHGHDHGSELEFEPVPVKVLFRDSKTAVIAAGGQLKAGDSIAVNKAYQLQVALKSDSGGGGHDHHGHSH